MIKKNTNHLSISGCRLHGTCSVFWGPVLLLGFLYLTSLFLACVGVTCGLIMGLRDTHTHTHEHTHGASRCHQTSWDFSKTSYFSPCGLVSSALHSVCVCVVAVQRQHRVRSHTSLSYTVKL